MNTIENHLLHLNLGAGGSRDAPQGVVGTVSSRLIIIIIIMAVV